MSSKTRVLNFKRTTELVYKLCKQCLWFSRKPKRNDSSLVWLRPRLWEVFVKLDPDWSACCGWKLTEPWGETEPRLIRRHKADPVLSDWKETNFPGCLVGICRILKNKSFLIAHSSDSGIRFPVCMNDCVNFFDSKSALSRSLSWQVIYVFTGYQ